MHLAQFVHRYPPALGGSEAYAARLSAHCAARGDTVTVFTSSAIELEEMWRNPRPASEEPGVFRYRPLAFPLRRYVLKALSLLPNRGLQCMTNPCNPVCPGMWRAAKHYSGPLTAVHATAFPYSFPVACAAHLALMRGVPFLLTPFLHLGDPDNARDRTRAQYTKPHLQWLLRFAHRVFVQTQAERAAVLECGVPEANIVLQGLGVEPSECTGGDRIAARAAWNCDPRAVVIGHLANNSEEKGTCDLLRAMDLAWRRVSHLRIVLAGPEMPNFRKFWDAFPAKERVTRLGVLSDAQKRDFFAGIDAFALPSRSDSFGLVLLEAWANGKPNVVYAAGGPAEIVRHELDGLQVRCGDIATLEHALRRLTDAELRQAMGEAGRARLASEFSWEDKLDLVRNAYAK